MKKKTISLIYAVVCIMIFAGCSNNSEPQSPNVKVPTIMYDGQLYSATSEKVLVEIDEHDYLGIVDSEVAISEWPQIDGQTNHAPYLDAPYTIFEDKFILLVEGEWVYCKLREAAQQDAPLNNLKPMLMVDGKLYLDTGVIVEPVTSITAFDNEITSTVDQSEKPKEDGQSNFGCVGNSYAVDDKGIIVIIDDKWVRFEIE